MAAITSSRSASTLASIFSFETLRDSSIFGSGVLISKRSAVVSVLTPAFAAIVAFSEVAGFVVEPVLDLIPLSPKLTSQIERVAVVVLVVVCNRSATLALEHAIRRPVLIVSVVVRPDFADGIHGRISASCLSVKRNPQAPR